MFQNTSEDGCGDSDGEDLSVLCADFFKMQRYDLDLVYVDVSNINCTGFGVFAKRRIEAGQVITRYEGIMLRDLYCGMLKEVDISSSFRYTNEGIDTELQDRIIELKGYSKFISCFEVSEIEVQSRYYYQGLSMIV